MFGQGFNYGFFEGPPCFTDTTDIFKDNSGVALYTLDYDASDSGNATGKFGESAVLTGTSSQINFPDIPLSAFDAAAVSVSLWVNMQAVTSGYSSGSYVFRGRGNWIIQVTSSGIVFQKYDTGPGNNGNNDLSYNFPGGTNLNQWYHIVVTDNGTATSGLNLYVDGVLRDSNSGYANIDDNSWLAGIANYAGRAGGNFKVDQLRIFNKEISSSEVTTLYNETKNTTNTLQILGDTSCIATYTFDGSSTDLSGNYNGTDTNILYKYDGTPTNVDFGVGGKSLYGAGFNGSSSRIQISSTSTDPVNISTGTFSISMWINMDNLTNNNKLVYKWGTTAANRNFAFTVLSSSGFLYWIEGSTSGDVLRTGTFALSTNTWHHIALTREQGGSLKMYVDGDLKDTFAATGTFKTSTEPIYLGYQVGQTTNFDGKIDQVRLFSKVLSSSEVSKLYGNGAGEIACAYTSTTDNIAFPIANTAYYKLDNNSKDSARSRGKFNQGATFVGNSAGIVNTTLQLSSTAHSVSLWMKPQDLTATKWQVMFFSAFNGYPSFTLGKRPDRTTSFHYRNESSNEVYFTLSNANTWYHVVVTRNNSGSTVYVNGSSVATDSNSMGTYSSSAYQKASIGSNPNYPAEYFDGTLDQIRVYDVALTSTDVANLYNSETTSTTNTLAFPTGKTAIATYTLDGNGVDVSGNYSGSEGDNIVYAYDGTESNIEYKFGKFGQAAVFDGYNSVIEASNVSGLNNATAVSASLWFNWDDSASVSNYGHIINIGTGTLVNGDFFGLAVGDDGGSYNRVLYGYFPEGSSSTGQTVTDNVWHHAVIVYEGTSVKYYYDGSLIATHTKTALSLPSSGNNITIGEYAYNGSHHFKGQIDQVRIFSTALDSDQISQLYNEKPETDTSNFKTVLYEANASTNFISNVGFQPGLVWTKSRDNAYNHLLYDSVRGTGNYLQSNTTIAQAPFNANTLSSFEATGFILGNVDNSNYLNNTSSVAWVWKGSGFQPSQTFSNIKTQGLIAHWNATQSSSLYPGSTWYDLTSNNRNLTHYTTGVSNINIGNNNGGVINMNSTDQFYTPQFINDQTFTIGGWYRRDALGSAGYENLWSQGYSPSVRLQIYGSGGASTGDRIYHYLDNGSSGNSYNTGIDTPKGVWFHIMVTYDFSNGTVKLYLNGSLVHTASTITGSIYSASNSDAYFRVARNSTNSNGYINGAISQIRVYSDVLTDAEVLNDYNATKNLFQTNNNGNISATVDANVDAGFSIVKYTGNNLANMTVGHGLDNPPELIITKRTDTTVEWGIYTTVVTGGPSTNWLEFNTGAFGSGNYMNVSDTLLSAVATGAYWIQGNQIAYCFHSVPGYSKIGSYSGTSSSGNAITGLGFQPNWLMVKRTDANGNSWLIVDNKRVESNGNLSELFADTTSAESGSGYDIDFTSDGFTLNTTTTNANASGTNNYIYMAFK